MKHRLEIRSASDEAEKGPVYDSYLESCLDKGEKGRGAPNSFTALLIGPFLIWLGWIGLCGALDTINGWWMAEGLQLE